MVWVLQMCINRVSIRNDEVDKLETEASCMLVVPLLAMVSLSLLRGWRIALVVGVFHGGIWKAEAAERLSHGWLLAEKYN